MAVRRMRIGRRRAHRRLTLAVLRDAEPLPAALALMRLADAGAERQPAL